MACVIKFHLQELFNFFLYCVAVLHTEMILIRGKYTVKVNGYTFRENNSAIFKFAYLFKRGPLLKKRICSIRSKFFSLRVDSLFEGFVAKTSRKSEKLSPFEIMVEKDG